MRKPPLQDVIVKNRRDTHRTTAAVRRPRPSVDEVEEQSEVHRAHRPLHEREEQQVEQEDVMSGHESQSQHDDMDDEFPLQYRGGRTMSPTNKRWLFIALGIGAVVVLSSVVLSFLFAGATVTVYPKQDTVVVGATFNVVTGGEATEGALPVERITRERTATHAVVALGEEEVEERANGAITIYNEYSDTPQRLIKNTRFESSEGRIYRIRNSVEVPGQNADGSAGSVEVTVYAEEPGETYNMGPDTFSVPGFVGLPQEGKVYAKSTSGIDGGFIGVRRHVNESDRMKAIEKLESQLRDELRAEAFESVDKPEGYHLFKEAVFFEFNPMSDESKETDQVVLSLSGKLHGILFPDDIFAQHLARITFSTYDGSPLRIDNLKDLSVSVTPTKTENEEIIAPWEANRYEVEVQGKARFIWEFDAERLTQDLLNKDKELLDSPYQGGILEGYPGIDRLEVSLRPFWKGAFPESPEDIVIITELDD